MNRPPLAPPAAPFRDQAGVATIDQLVAAGWTRSGVAAQTAARRWQRVGSRCVVAHNSELTRAQWAWVALLDPQAPTALAGFTALEVGGFRYFGDEPEPIHVVVQRGARYHRFPGVQVHESRRFHPGDVVRSHGVPHLPFARSALDAGAWQPRTRYACGVLAAVVQQRICTAGEVSEALPRVGRIRHKQAMRLALLDIAGGAEALGEIDVAALCRTFGLAPPHRQTVRRDRHGRRRFLDCEWDLPSGAVVVLEVDGSHHLLVEHWEADIKRERGLVVGGRTVLRATAHEVRYEQGDVAADLLAAGVPPL